MPKKTAYSMNAGTTSGTDIYEYAKEEWGEDPEKKIPGFRENFELLRKKTKSAPGIPRIQMPVIEPSDIREFMERIKAGRVDIFAPYAKGKLVGPKNLSREDGPWVELGIKDGDTKDDVVRAKMTKIPVGKLKPTQNQIWMEKVIGNIGKWGVPTSGSPVTKTTIIVSSDGYILDGHHRFGQALLADPNLKMDALLVPLPIKQLLEIGRLYGEAIGNKAKQGSMSLTAADRSVLIRLAYRLPIGSEERRAILVGLKR